MLSPGSTLLSPLSTANHVDSGVVVPSSAYESRIPHVDPVDYDAEKEDRTVPRTPGTPRMSIHSMQNLLGGMESPMVGGARFAIPSMPLPPSLVGIIAAQAADQAAKEQIATLSSAVATASAAFSGPPLPTVQG